MLLSISQFWQEHSALAILLCILVIVIPLLVFYCIKAHRDHPKGLIPAAIANMGERFGYYIMNASATPPPAGFMPCSISSSTCSAFRAA